MATNITQEQLNTAQAFAAAKDYKGGWAYLASLGDNYADDAYAVTSGNYSNPMQYLMAILVKEHWENTTPGAYDTTFALVAAQHFKQYVDGITLKPIVDTHISTPNKK